MPPSDQSKVPRPLRVAWISDFPIEWLPQVPDEIAQLPKQHPTTWEWVLQQELEHDRGIELHIFILRNQAARSVSFSLGRTTYHVLKIPPRMRAPSIFWLDTWILGRALRKLSPDLVHAWGSERGAALTASRLPYPHLMTIQGLFSWYKERVSLGRYEKFIAWIEKQTLARVPVVTTESRFSVEFLRARYPQMIVHQAEHAPSWLFHRIERKPQLQPTRILCVGTLGLRKGTDLLLRALDSLRNDVSFEVVVVGSSDELFLGSLRTEISPELWNRITFHERLTPQEIGAELSIATFLVLPTRADTSPNAVKEAVVAGVPVLASDVGGIPDYVHPGSNGMLVPAGDLPALARAILEMARHPLFGIGCVDEKTLIASREYLSPSQMHKNFTMAYAVVLDRARFAETKADFS